MKTNRTRKATTAAFALIAWLLLPGTGNCFYNPSTGRWISRDPSEEDGGSNLYEYANNDFNHVDPLGECPSGQCALANCPFTVTDLGYHPPIVRKKKHYQIDGLTTLTSWTLTTDINNCSCGKKVVIHACWAGAKYWWANYAAAVHERVHVYVWQNGWDDAVDVARRYANQCVSASKAFCYQALISLYSRAYKTDAQANNFEFDCAVYGHSIPTSKVCAQAAKFRAQAQKLLAAASRKEQECATR